MKDKAEFNFGENWLDYSLNKLDLSKVDQARLDLSSFLHTKSLENKTFLDIGCGSGLMSIAASQLGAKSVTGLDISDESIQASSLNAKKFVPKSRLTFKKMSIFDSEFNAIKAADVVYCWGVLHHTGEMWKAIDLTLSKVNKGGLFAIAIYNRHSTSIIWRYIKFLYNKSPNLVKKMFIYFFYWLIALAKFVVTGKNPFSKSRRGMNYYYDVVDWVGGYPYEFASPDEIKEFIEPRGFTQKYFIKSEVPTGCNEFVFQKV